MKPLLALLALPILAATLVPAAARAQTRDVDPAQGPTFRTGVDVMAVDVAVLDGNGQPLEDLRAPDFTVKIDGEPRRVVSATLVRFDTESPLAKADDKTETFYSSNLSSPSSP